MVRASTSPTAEMWCDSLTLPPGLFGQNIFERVEIVGCPVRASVPNELVRLNLNLFDDVSLALQVRSLLRRELEPFIIGVGEVIVEDTSEGIIVLRRNSRLEADYHQPVTSR